uniref:Uncharacterized protein n=1 Tax=Arundo donax TaxID=35708 RepID=A0A0A9AZW7_ARUDO
MSMHNKVSILRNIRFRRSRKSLWLTASLLHSPDNTVSRGYHWHYQHHCLLPYSKWMVDDEKSKVHYLQQTSRTPGYVTPEYPCLRKHLLLLPQFFQLLHSL